MATYLWNAFTDRGNLAGTALDSLADNTMSAASTELNNATNLDTHAIIEVNLGSLTPVTPGAIHIYMTKAPDGANHEDAPVTGGVDVPNPVAVLPVKAGAATKRIMTGLITLPPYKVKFYVDNKLGAAMAASGNTLDVYTGRLASA